MIPAAMPEQQIGFCRSSDGVQIAYSVIGSGPPLVKTGNWMTHLEKRPGKVQSGVISGADMARDHTLLRYDARGTAYLTGRSRKSHSEAFVRDLEAAVDAAGPSRSLICSQFPGRCSRIDNLCGPASRNG